MPRPISMALQLLRCARADHRTRGGELGQAHARRKRQQRHPRLAIAREALKPAQHMLHLRVLGKKLAYGIHGSRHPSAQRSCEPQEKEIFLLSLLTRIVPAASDASNA